MTQFGIDENNMIIEGHGRYEALKQLNYTEVPCIELKGMTEEQKKAYLLDYKAIDRTAGEIVGYSNRNRSIEYGPTYRNVWVPKSQVQLEGNKVVAMPDWLAKKNGLVTESMEKQKAQRQSDYNNLVKKAKSLGIKGARKGLKAKTLRSMIEQANR